MVRKRDGLPPIGEVFSDLDGSVKAEGDPRRPRRVGGASPRPIRGSRTRSRSEIMIGLLPKPQTI